jgi:hypothetical protein
MAKKVKIECEDSKLYETVAEYYQVDSALPNPTTDWEDPLFMDDPRSISLLDSMDSDLVCCSPSDNSNISTDGDVQRSKTESRLPPKNALKLLQSVADYVFFTIGEFNPLEWKGRHGPGAVSDCRDSTKYGFPNWSDKLSTVFDESLMAYANYSLVNDEDVDPSERPYLYKVEPPSKLIAVPKTQKGPRLIASEPTANQWCQQAIKDFLVERLQWLPLRRSIHFRDQVYNQQAALKASFDCAKATIDLSAASDRVSCWFAERMLRSNPSLLSAIKASRSSYISNDIDKKRPKLYKLRKLSSMGSAITFPVQSYFFTCIAITAILYDAGKLFTNRNVSWAARQVLVFGDDIIIPVENLGTMRDLLVYFRFKVNDQKTFGTGKFRESCGMDAYDGYDVTPVYILQKPNGRKPESIESVVASHNHFVRNGYEHAASYLKKTTMLAMPYLGIPTCSVGSDLGLVWESYDGLSLLGLQKRYNKQLHRMEVQCHTSYARVRTKVHTGLMSLLQYFTEAPKPDDPWVAGWRTKPASQIRRRWRWVGLFS